MAKAPTHRNSQRFYDRFAPLYDLSNQLAALVRGTSDAGSRRHAIRRLDLRPGNRVLEVAVGTGSNLAFLSQASGPNGLLVGLDISTGMLARCARRAHRNRLRVDLIQGDAGRLPFADGSFDAVFHFGGIAEFPDARAAIGEMARVARAGAKIVICDVGVPTDRPMRLINRLILKLQPVYNRPPPLDVLPAGTVPHISWFRGDAWYLIEFVK